MRHPRILFLADRNSLAKQALNAFLSFPEDALVRLYDRQATVGTAHVHGSTFCNFIVDVDEQTRRLRMISHIDNLMKGQAGNALQDMNLICALPETMGLDHPDAHP